MLRALFQCGSTPLSQTRTSQSKTKGPTKQSSEYHDTLSSYPCNSMGNRNDNPASLRRKQPKPCHRLRISNLSVIGIKVTKKGDIISQVLNVRITPRIFSCTLRSAVHSNRTCSRFSSSVITANSRGERPVNEKNSKGWAPKGQ